MAFTQSLFSKASLFQTIHHSNQRPSMAFTPTLFSKASLFSYRRNLCIQLASAFHEFQPNKKWRPPAASVLKLGGVKIAKDGEAINLEKSIDILLFCEIRVLEAKEDLKNGKLVEALRYYPPCYKDMSFWISDSFTENNLCEVVRGIAGDLVEEVKLIDNFTNKKGMTSHCYRIAYRSMERSLTDEEINDLQWRVREQVETKLLVVLR
ncbi:unnamed protein product [Fraxinus pennsylvanica]|uniref:phenylalanine--tRNA ligase n=1 Tax=Fraxinus pennsylvanica TaxID=56036 RepID=A0AAD2ABY0_9LAMI|nr:unnamed protein product [Fraxinus pennsylvanica]